MYVHIRVYKDFTVMTVIREMQDAYVGRLMHLMQAIVVLQMMVVRYRRLWISIFKFTGVVDTVLLQPINSTDIVLC